MAEEEQTDQLAVNKLGQIAAAVIRDFELSELALERCRAERSPKYKEEALSEASFFARQASYNATTLRALMEMDAYFGDGENPGTGLEAAAVAGAEPDEEPLGDFPVDPTAYPSEPEPHDDEYGDGPPDDDEAPKPS